MSARQTKINLASKSAALTAFKSTTVYKAVSCPSAASNFLDAYKNASRPSTSLTNEFQIQTMPDFSPILMEIIYHVNKDMPKIDVKGDPKVSSTTYVAYCLTILYAHFALTDMHINPIRSRFAAQLLDDSEYHDYLQHCLTLPVPHFMLPILNVFKTTNTSERSNIWTAPSFAGFTHFTHFGRFFPINIFTNLHDYAASTTARIPPADAHIDIALLEVFSIKNYHYDTTNTTWSPITYAHANFFASLYPSSDTTNPRRNPNLFHSSKLNQVLEGLYNPVLFRAHQQRPNLSSLNLFPLEFDHANYNPYLVNLCLSHENVSELTTFTSTVASVLVDEGIAASDLSSVYSTYTSSTLLDHGYSAYPLPTWDADCTHVNTTIAEADFKSGNNFIKFQGSSDTDHATRIAFKSSLTSPAVTWTHRTATLGRIDVSARSTRADPQLDLCTVTCVFVPSTTPSATISLARIQHQDTLDNASTFPIPTAPTANVTIADVTSANMAGFDIISYSTARDYEPSVKVLQIPSFDEVTAHQIPLRGMVIFSEELTGSIVPHANPGTGIAQDNAMFLQSGITFNLTHLATNFSSRVPVPSRMTVPRPLDCMIQPAVTRLRHHTRTYHLTFAPQTLDLGTSILHPGLTTADDTILPAYTQTHIGYDIQVRPGRRAPTHIQTQPPSTPNQHLLVWSPYTFVSSTSPLDWTHEDLIDTRIPHPLTHYVFLTNMRTIYGLNSILGEVRSASAAMPV
jgi:hypothetical protein